MARRYPLLETIGKIVLGWQENRPRPLRDILEYWEKTDAVQQSKKLSLMGLERPEENR